MTSGPVLAVVQARHGSTRLPGKVLAPLAGTTVLGLLLDRLAGAATLDRIVVATTGLAEDDAVVAEARLHGAEVVRGEEDDVLGRYLLAVQRWNPAIVVRLTGDCPLTDPGLVDQVVKAVRDGHAEVAANDADGYLRGFDVEAMLAGALVDAGQSTEDPIDRVHVTPWLYAHPERHAIEILPWPGQHGHLRVTVDTAEDLEVVRGVCALLPDPRTATWRDVVAVLEAHPDLAAGNAQVRQKHLEEG